MSIEIQAAFQCPHLIMEEPVQLGSDRQSLVTRAPVSGAGSVRILVNNSIYVPPSGLHSQATLTAGVPGPYRIERCVGTAGPDGNLFTVTTSTGSATVRLPEGSQVTLNQIQKCLRLSEVNNLVSIFGRNGALSLVDSNDAGTESFVRVSGKGASSLGFQQKGARGAEIYPPWGLSSRSDVYPSSAIPGVQYVRARYPKFTRPIAGNPDIKVTYASMPERCPRCEATYVENDWRFDPVGDVITIANEDLLVQACLKAILTIQGSNPFHPKYGSALNTRIGQKAFGPTASLIQEDVSQALSRVQALQRGQRKYQNVSDKELLYSIQSVDVRPSAEDPTIFYVNVVVRNGSAEPISLNVAFTVPGTIALAGSNGQTLGLERAGITPSQSARLLLERDVFSSSFKVAARFLSSGEVTYRFISKAQAKRIVMKQKTGVEYLDTDDFGPKTWGGVLPKYLIGTLSDGSVVGMANYYDSEEDRRFVEDILRVKIEGEVRVLASIETRRDFRRRGIALAMMEILIEQVFKAGDLIVLDLTELGSKFSKSWFSREGLKILDGPHTMLVNYDPSMINIWSK